MGQNESKAPGKFKINQNHDHNKTNNEGNKLKSPGIDKAPNSTLNLNKPDKSVDKNHLSTGKPAPGDFSSFDWSYTDSANVNRCLELSNAKFNLDTGKPSAPGIISQEHKFDQSNPFICTTQSEGQEGYKQSPHTPTINPQEQKYDENFLMFSSKEKQETNKKTIFEPAAISHTNKREDNREIFMCSQINIGDQNHHKQFIHSATLPHNQNYKGQDLILKSKPQESKDYEAAIHFNKVSLHDHKEYEKAGIFSLTQPQGNNSDRADFSFCNDQPKKQTNDKHHVPSALLGNQEETVIFSLTQSQGDSDRAEVSFCNNQPEKQSNQKHHVSTAELENQEETKKPRMNKTQVQDGKEPVFLCKTETKEMENRNLDESYITNQTKVKNVSSLPQDSVELLNKDGNMRSDSMTDEINKPNKITSGNPFLQSNSKGKMAKDILGVNVNDQSLVIPPVLPENIDTPTKDAEHIKQVDSLLLLSHKSSSSLNISSNEVLSLETVNKSQSRSLRDEQTMGSTNDKTIKKTLKQVEKIAESLAGSSDKNIKKDDSVKTEIIDFPSKGRHNQIVLHSCIVKMRNIDSRDQESVQSLQKEIVSHLREMEHFTLALKSCPIINSNIVTLCETIKLNLRGLKANNEIKSTYKTDSVTKTKAEFKQNSQDSTCFPKVNQSKYFNDEVDNNTTSFVASNQSNDVPAFNPDNKNVTDDEASQAVTISLTPFMTLLDQLPEYLAVEKQYISLRNTKLYCRVCNKPIAFSLLNLQEHLCGKNHRGLVAALKHSICARECPSSVGPSDISVPISSGSSAEQRKTCLEVETPIKTNLPPNYKGVLDLISQSIKEGFHFGVNVYICLLCDFFENDKSKALNHVESDHKDQQHTLWYCCETCLIHMYGTNTHFKDHRLTEQHIAIAKLKKEHTQGEAIEKQHVPEIVSVTDEMDRMSVCSSKSDTSNRSRTKIKPYEILLSIAKTKKGKGLRGPFGLYCQLCNKYDTEKVVFTDHCGTQKHHEAKNKFKGKVVKFKKCSTCEILLVVDDEVWKEHQELQIHNEILALNFGKHDEDTSRYVDSSKSNLEPRLSRSSGAPMPIDISRSVSSESDNTSSYSPNGQEDIGKSFSERLSSFNECGPHYDFMKTVLKKNLEKKPTKDWYGLFCHLCQVYFFDQDQWETHLRSNPHKTKLKSPVCAGRRVQYDCGSCNIQLIGEEDFYSLHLQSLAHKAISRIPERRDEMEETETEEDYSEDEDDDEDEYDSSENEEDEENLQEKLDNSQRNSNVQAQDGQNNGICIPNGVYFRGIPSNAVEKDIAEFFRKFGPLKSIKIFKRNCSGNCVYKRKIDAITVLEKKTVFINRTPVIVRPLITRQLGKKKATQFTLSPDVTSVLTSPRTLVVTIAEVLSDMNRNYHLNQKKGLEISQDLSTTIPGCRVLFFGSQVTGLATVQSDFDIYIDYDGKSFYTDLNYDTQQAIIRHLQDQLTQRGSRFAIRETILEARVPIIRVVHMRTNTLCDISCRSGLSVENSHLVRVYLDLDSRVRWLVVAIKFWMQSNDLLDRNAFTSYASVWLVLFFLMRTTNPVVCPVVTLQKNCKPYTVARWDCRFHRDMKDIMRYFRSYNQQSELALLSAFFQMYASFPFKSSVMCPLNGNVLTRKQFQTLNLPREFSPYREKVQSSKTAERLKIQTPICLQDPFDLSHNITKGVNRTDLDKFKKLCSESHKMCQRLLLDKMDGWGG